MMEHLTCKNFFLISKYLYCSGIFNNRSTEMLSKQKHTSPAKLKKYESSSKLFLNRLFSPLQGKQNRNIQRNRMKHTLSLLFCSFTWIFCGSEATDCENVVCQVTLDTPVSGNGAGSVQLTNFKTLKREADARRYTIQPSVLL